MADKFVRNKFKIENSLKQSISVDQFKTKVFPDKDFENFDLVIKNRPMDFSVHKLVSDQIKSKERRRNFIDKELEEEIESRINFLRKEAEERGYADGMEIGKKEAFHSERKKIEGKFDHLKNILHDLDFSRELIFKENEKFIMKILSRLLNALAIKEIDLDYKYTACLISKLIQEFNDKGNLKISISKPDYEFLTEIKKIIKKQFPDFKNSTFFIDKSMLPGECKISTENTVIDAKIDQQIQQAMLVLDKNASSS